MLTLPDEEKSLWRDVYRDSLYPTLNESIAVDVVVVGGGITGLSSAYLLKRSGFKVAMVEKDTVGGGTTGRTTGKVTSQHGLTYANLEKIHGKQIARLYGESNHAAVEQVAQIISKEKIDCDWSRQDNYVFTVDSAQLKKFKAEAKTATKVGLPANFETTTPLPFAVKGAVKFTNQAKLHAQKYLLGLAKAVHGSGSFVFENSNVTRIKDGANPSIRANGRTITAKDIIVATNVPTMPLAARGGYCILEYPMESYIVVGRLARPLKAMYISPDDDHYSILPFEADGQKLVLIGGEGHISGRRISTKSKHRRLANYAEEKLGVKEITHRWSDRDYLSYDHIPLIGKLYPWSRHVYVGSAFKKWGLSNGTVAAMILTDLIIGKPNQWAAAFDSTRSKPIQRIPHTFVEKVFG